MNILVTLCARGGSKGIPLKNIKEIDGKPLIAYSIETAQAFKEKLKTNNISVDIELSTDSNKIREVAANFGLTTNYLRPDILAQDETGKISVIKHIYEYASKERACQYDLVLDLDISSPLRTVTALLEALQTITSDENALNLFSVSPAHKNPYFNMVEIAEDGYARLVKKLPSDILSRQKAPIVYDMNASFYFYTKKFFELDSASALTKKSLIYVMDHICFDIDTPIDLLFIDFLISNKKLEFSL